MGSQSSITKKDLNFAYISGFLDGDGSLMLQVKKRSDTKQGWRFMTTICFYQDSNHEQPLYWIKQKLRAGYITKRKDSMTELRINGYSQCYTILKQLFPYIQFKKLQAKYLMQAINILNQKSITKLSLKDREKLLFCMNKIQSNNYKSSRKKSEMQLRTILGLTP